MGSFAIVGHFHECETTGTARVPIGHDTDAIHGAMGFKQGANVIFRCPKTEVSYKNFHIFDLI